MSGGRGREIGDVHKIISLALLCLELSNDGKKSYELMYVLYPATY
jgi:hypothetical protein